MHLFHRYNRHVNFIVLSQRRKTRPAMSDRFFVETPITGTRAELADAEARHLTGVLRAGVGDAVTLFDGSGAEFASRILRVGKSVVELEVLERQEISRELPLDMTLAVALPKGDRQKWLVEKLVELGVTRLVPLITERGVAQPVDSALARLKRGVIEASKQCGRNKLMEIAEPRDAGARRFDGAGVRDVRADRCRRRSRDRPRDPRHLLPPPRLDRGRRRRPDEGVMGFLPRTPAKAGTQARSDRPENSVACAPAWAPAYAGEQGK